MKTSVLKPEYIKAIKKNPQLAGNIAQVLGRNMSSVYRYMREPVSDELTKPVVLDEIRKYLGIPESTVLFDIIEVTND